MGLNALWGSAVVTKPLPGPVERSLQVRGKVGGGHWYLLVSMLLAIPELRHEGQALPLQGKICQVTLHRARKNSQFAPCHSSCVRCFCVPKQSWWWPWHADTQAEERTAYSSSSVILSTPQINLGSEMCACLSCVCVCLSACFSPACPTPRMCVHACTCIHTMACI